MDALNFSDFLQEVWKLDKLFLVFEGKIISKWAQNEVFYVLWGIEAYVSIFLRKVTAA